MYWRGVALFFLFFLRPPTGLAKNENEGESEIFCQLRLLAENDPEKLVFGNEEREKQILRRIEKVGPEIRGLSGQAHTREVSLTAQFNGIAQEAKKLMGTVRDMRRKAVEKRLSAKRHLHQVIFGEYVGNETVELGQAKETIRKIFSSTTFTESCGGKGDKPTGKSLINDFICLCAHWFDPKNDDQSICKSRVDTSVNPNFSNWTAVWHWNNHRICVNTPPLTPTPQNIHKLVALFERAVERNQTGSQVKGVFGYVKDDNTEKICNGSKVSFTCVNYNYTLKNGGIEWVNHLKNASEDLQDMARCVEESESSLPQLELLEYNALLLYEEAKYSTHLPHITPSNETDTNSSNESYPGDPTNTSEEDKLEEEDSDATWKGRPPWWGLLFFFLFVF
ncbi:Variant surface glycoprotein [Trypanosoma congolense IL3000]|uniref:Variant surface glycoprotein n=1 Tax=Trypanosoma congolense (strain IL3000) TaxID=1068625 RepID=F9W9D8_TRYCI|nr:Variant surface glycoprotein [Trypanosoma congolense IL3000]